MEYKNFDEMFRGRNEVFDVDSPKNQQRYFNNNQYSENLLINSFVLDLN